MLLEEIPMRVLLLTAHTSEGEVQHRYVAKRLISEFGDSLVAIIVATGSPKSRVARIRRWWQRYSLGELASRVMVRAVRRLTSTDQRRQAVFRQIFFPEGDDQLMPGGERVHRVASHNSPECRALLKQYDADVVIVYGTLIIGRKTIDACQRPINLHTGWSPRYRGSDTIFWALHNGEPEYAGVTVHRLVQGVDAGAILARGRPKILDDDDEATLFAKAVKLGAELLCSSARREAAGESRPLEQDLASGTEYRSVARSVAAERRMLRRLAEGQLKGGLDEWREEF